MTAYKWVINVRTRLYAVCLSLSTFSSVVHFRCRLTFQLSMADVLPSQTSKGKGRMTESENSYISQIDDRPNQPKSKTTLQ